MYLTDHVKSRSQQRGIPTSEIELIVRYGEPSEAGGEATAYQVNGKTKNMIISRLKNLIQRVENISDEVVVISSDGAILTTYHK